jgi:peptide-methionine (S)-S-oxide reductase
MSDGGGGTTELATLGGGCFWCLEAVFEQLEGVVSVDSGYSGGHVDDPTYAQVCSGTTGHAEVTRIEFDPDVLPYRDLLGVFFATHDPTTLNRQGADVGTQYRSVVFSHSDRQREEAAAIVKELEAEGVFGAPIVTEIVPEAPFYPAEEYHRDYYRRNPEQAYCRAVITPKVAKFRSRFAHRLKNA